MSKIPIILVDDDLVVRTHLRKELAAEYNVNDFDNGEAAVQFFKTNVAHIALLDVDLGVGINGIETMQKLIQLDPYLSVIMISKLADIETVVQSIRIGAFDYIEKPINIDKLKFRITKALDFRQIEMKSQRYDSMRMKEELKNEIVGNSTQIEQCKKMIAKAGPMRMLFLGETGVGKTPFARYSNSLLSREYGKERPFEHINCASIKHERFVDELFGHVKGAYTGAVSDKKGLVELAEGGDLFLDEIGDLDLECQAELLTYLDHYEYYKLGGTRKHKTEVRIITATNKDLKSMIKEGTFRKDLYTRISQRIIEIPPLRERKEDIELLLKHFIKIFTGEDKPIDSSVFEQLKRFDWEEGNVRALRNTAEYMCISSRAEDSITMEHVPEDYTNFSLDDSAIKTDFSLDDDSVYEVGYPKYIESIEYKILKYLIGKEPKKAILAKNIKMDRSTLKRKLIKLNLE